MAALQMTAVLHGDYDLKIARQDYFLSKQERVRCDGTEEVLEGGKEGGRRHKGRGTGGSYTCMYITCDCVIIEQLFLEHFR